MARAHEFSAKVRKEAYALSGGICAACGMPIDGRCEFDHILPVAFGGKGDTANCAVLHKKCHRHKTSTADVPAISKAERILEKRLGIRKSQWPMRWKR